MGGASDEGVAKLLQEGVPFAQAPDVGLGDEGLGGGRISEGGLPGVVGLLHEELLGMVRRLVQVRLLHAGWGT